jgi:hypothetical protein
VIVARPIAVLLLSAAVFGATAQRGWAAEDGIPAITVRPSGVLDEGAEARERQEDLLRRMEQSEYAFRAICRVCGSPGRFEGPQPFEPYRALGSAAPRE